MRNKISMFLAMVLWQVAIGSAEWPNEPVGSQPFLDCPFSGNICSMASTYNTFPFAEPGGANQLSPGVLDEAMTGSSATANGQWGIGFPARMREVYMGMSWRTTVWGAPSGTNKMIFISDPSNSFLVWQGTPGTGAKTLKWYQQEYIDNCHISNMCPSKSGDGTGVFEPNVNAAAATIAPDDNIFHRIEIYLRGSTTRTSQDGVIRIWVDGVLSTNYANVNQGIGGGITQGPPYSFTGGEFPGGFRSATITATWDGGTGTQCKSPSNPYGRDCSHEWHHYFDHLYISFPQDAPPLTQVFTTISVTPDQVTVLPSATQQFAATALDQYGLPMTPQPAFSWSVNGGGTVNSSGLFTAGASLGGPFTVTASANGKSGTTQFSVGEAVGKNAFIGTYFQNMDLTGPILTRMDNSINFEWGYNAPAPSVPADSFSVRWEGDFNFPVAGTFPFTARVDDGIRIYLDGSKILDQWRKQQATTYTVNQPITAGIHRVKVEYYDYKYDAVAQISFSGSIPAEITAKAPVHQRIGLSVLRNSGNSLEFGITVPSAEAFTLRLMDTKGGKVWEKRNAGNVRSVVCSRLTANGLYVAILKQGNRQVMRKFAVIR